MERNMATRTFDLHGR